GLAALYRHEEMQLLNPLPDARSRHRQAAERAIELDPASQDGWRELAMASFMSRDLSGLRMAADKILLINPLDVRTLAFAGMLLTYAGDEERGLEMSERAAAPNPLHPGWYHFAPFMAHYKARAYEKALLRAKRLNM